MDIMQTRRRSMAAFGTAAIGVLALALTISGSAAAKSFTRATLVGSDSRWVDVHVRLFFVGPGDFPANPGRYYPEPECVDGLRS